MVQQTLESSFEQEPVKPQKKKLDLSAREALRKKIIELTTEVSDLEPSILVSATYDGARRVAVLKFYDPRRNRIYLWSDNTGHKPYCYSRDTVAQVKSQVKGRANILDVVSVRKKDLLADKEIEVSQIIAADPLAIGGQDRSLRNEMTLWEADIKYYENYAYDHGLLFGAYYRINKGVIQATPFETPKEVGESLKKTIELAKPEMRKAIADWAALLNQPLPDLKRAALDIEVLSPENRIPNPQEAMYPVVGASIVSKDLKRTYLLERKDSELGHNELPVGTEAFFFESERDLIISLFTDMLDYPFLATFNGDDFDLDYLYHRAQRPEIGLMREDIPIQLGNNFAALKHGVHIDLYKTYNNRSLQVYAFGNKYSDKTLNGVSEALLGKTKIEYEGLIGDLPIYEMARYNLWDTILTYELFTINNDVLMKLLMVIARVGKMPIDDLSRLGVSNWIRSMLYFEHRQQNALIPRPEELADKGGAKSEAIIKGKKYKGGLVIDPKSGIHFNVAVLDFASLYPSIIKVFNISYETVNCPHEECHKNKIPEVGTWYCSKRRGIESLVVGSLRDLRVDYYKQLTKSKTLSKEEKDLYKVVSQGLKVILNACFTGDTEILTPNGIKNIKDVRVGDKVLSVNPSTMMPEIDEVVETQVFPYNDKLYCFKNGKQVDLKVTKNHRFLVEQGLREPTFLEAQDIEKWTNICIPKINSPIIVEDESQISLSTFKGNDKFAIALPLAITGRHVDSQFSELWAVASKLGYYNKQTKSFFCDNLTDDQINAIKSLGGSVFLSSGHSRYPFEFKKADFAELCGWIVSEGYTGGTPEKIYENGNHRELDYRVFIAQEQGPGNPRGNLFRTEIRELLARMKIDFKEYSTGFRIANPAIHRFCVSEIKKGARNKQVPSTILQSSTYVKWRLLEALCKGDGNLRYPRYTTTSEPLAQQVCCILAELGYHPRRYFDSVGKVYRIFWTSSAIGLMEAGATKNKWLTKEKFSGSVYCVTTKKNHTVFAGRNGIFAIVGQSYGILGFESFPLYCLPAAEAIATLGRYSITKTIEKCKELGIEVIYSDTDSLFLQAPSQEQILQVTEWTQKELGIELDVDKIYRYVAMSQRKKNYFGILSDGTFDLKGLTGKKSQTPQFIKNSFYKILDILTKVNTQDDFETAREEIKTLLKIDYSRLKEKQIPMEDLAFNVMIGKEISRYKDSIPQHVRAAQLMKKAGTDIRAGDIIAFVKTTTGDGAKPVKLAKPSEIDVGKYLEYMKSTFDQLLGSMGYDFDEILGATKLEDFFWGPSESGTNTVSAAS